MNQRSVCYEILKILYEIHDFAMGTRYTNVRQQKPDHPCSDGFEWFSGNRRTIFIIGDRYPGDGFKLCAEVLHAAVTHHECDFAECQLPVFNQFLNLFDFLKNNEFFKCDIFPF